MAGWRIFGPRNKEKANAAEVEALATAARLLSQGNYDEAITELDRIIAASSKEGRAYALRAVARLRRYGKTYERTHPLDRLSSRFVIQTTEDLQGARADLATVHRFKLAPRDRALIYLGSGSAFLELVRAGHSAFGMDEENDLKQAIVLDPNLGEAYNELGLLYLVMGNTADALRNLEMVAKLTPNNPEVFFARSAAHLLAGSFPQALADAERVMALDPGSGKAYYARGVAYHGLENRDQAVSDLRKAIELATDSVVRRKAQEALQALESES
jgi:tetratricopeptide (TPR) repeat protein